MMALLHIIGDVDNCLGPDRVRDKDNNGQSEHESISHEGHALNWAAAYSWHRRHGSHIGYYCQGLLVGALTCVKPAATRNPLLHEVAGELRRAGNRSVPLGRHGASSRSFGMSRGAVAAPASRHVRIMSRA
jgi:hypothetical protein